jgi:glycosyltransferase involved in cell wall biosynthesis
MKPLISVIIPTYNEEKNIVKCIKSLENQSIPRKSYEIIVVDGNSKDNTVKLAKKLADRVIFQKSKKVGGARNDGIKLAKADIVATTDADCTVPRNWLENIIWDFGDERIGCVFGPVRPMERSEKNKYIISTNNLIAKILHHLRIFDATIGSNTSFRKSLFLGVGGYKQVSAGDDYEIAFRMRRVGRIKLDQRLTVNFSMRRFDKFGIFGFMTSWMLSIFSSILKKNLTKVEYSRQNYD